MDARALLASCGLVLVLAACGPRTESVAAPTAEATGAQAADGPAASCLAVADAARPRREGEPEKVSIKHVLVKYRGARSAPDGVTRSREEACLRAQEARSKLEGGQSFEEVVAAYSEEPGAVSRGGSIGAVTRAEVVPPFADAAFELRTGEVSHVVETPFGFHVLYRSE